MVPAKASVECEPERVVPGHRSFCTVRWTVYGKARQEKSMSSAELLPEGGQEPAGLVERSCESVLRLLPTWLPVSGKMFVTGHPLKERAEPEERPLVLRMAQAELEVLQEKQLEVMPACCCRVVRRSCTELDALFVDSVTPSSMMLMERDSGRLASVTAIRLTTQ